MRLQLEGRFELVLTRDGKICMREKVHNLIVASGESLVADLVFFNSVPNEPEYIAFGDDATAANRAQIALLNEFAVARQGASAGSSFASGGILHLEFTYVPSTLLSNVAEVGVFNALTVGTMISRAVVSQFSMDVTDSLFVIWELTFRGV